MANPFIGEAVFDLHVSGDDPPKAFTRVETEERRGMDFHDDTDIGKRAADVEWRMIADRPPRPSTAAKDLKLKSEQQVGKIVTVKNNAGEATPKVVVLGVQASNAQAIFPIINQDGDRLRLDLTFTLRNTK